MHLNFLKLVLGYLFIDMSLAQLMKKSYYCYEGKKTRHEITGQMERHMMMVCMMRIKNVVHSVQIFHILCIMLNQVPHINQDQCR